MPVAGLSQILTDHLAPKRLARLGVAVSGGGDSMALLHLLADWNEAPKLAVVTVDHGLRAAAADEARAVARSCAELGLPHDTLQWQWDGAGNLQDQARRGRLMLIGDWARARGIGAVALGHTADDQAETLLMRLARGSGVDGLAAMAGDRRAGGVLWLRPLLTARRADLREYLTARGLRWAEDPSNDDLGYDRIKARKTIEQLGLDVPGLVATAERLQMAREALELAADQLARTHMSLTKGDVLGDLTALLEAPEETRLRLLAGALCSVSGADYRPRIEALRGALVEVTGGRAATLHGCLILPVRGQIRIAREYQAVRDLTGPPAATWDNRWRLSGPETPGAEIRALGEKGLRDCPDWRGAGVPRAALLATPSVWQGARLIAAPLANLPNGWSAVPVFGPDDGFAARFVH